MYKQVDEAQKLVKEEKYPHISDERRSRFSGMEKSIFKAVKMCHVFDVDAQSSAEEVKQYLQHNMDRFNVPCAIERS